jgi:hypothetical protein
MKIFSEERRGEERRGEERRGEERRGERREERRERRGSISDAMNEITSVGQQSISLLFSFT